MCPTPINPYFGDSMNKEFLLNIIFLITVNLLIKPFFIFGIDRTVQNTVGTEDYGIYFVLLNFTYLFQIINDFGIQNYNNRQIAQHNQLLDKYFPNILVLKLSLGLLFLALVFLVGCLLGYATTYPMLLPFIAINHILVSLVFYLRSNISGLGKYRVDSLISVLDKVLMIGICSVLLWGTAFRDSFKIEWFVMAQTASLLLTAGVAFVVVWRCVERLRFKINLPFLVLLLKESFPFAIVIFLMTAYTRIDGVMIEQLLDDGAREAGVYASAYRLLDASNMIGFLFAGLLLPMFSKMIKQQDSVVPLLKQSFQMIWAGSLTLSIGTWFFRKEIMLLLYVEADVYWGEVLGYLMFSFIAVSGTYIVGTLLTAKGSLKKMNIIFTISIILNIILNFFLIPHYKASGAAIATFATQSFAFLAQLVLAKQEFKLKIDVGLLLRIVSFIGILIFAGLFFSNKEEWDWKISMLAFFTTGGGAAFLFKMIDLSALPAWFRQRKN